MVDIHRFNKEHPDPHVAAAEPCLADPEVAGAGEAEAVVDERNPQDGGAGPKGAHVSPQDLQMASAKAATP